jgi:hypothetical protein
MARYRFKHSFVYPLVLLPPDKRQYLVPLPQTDLLIGIQSGVISTEVPGDTMKGLKEVVASGKLLEKTNTIQRGAYHERSDLQYRG